MALIVRALLWLVLIIAPGGIFLLPFLVGDAVARRRKAEGGGKGDESPPGSRRVEVPVAR